MTLLAMQSQVRAQFKMALLQIPRKEKNMFFEDVIHSCEDPRLSMQVKKHALGHNDCKKWIYYSYHIVSSLNSLNGYYDRFKKQVSLWFNPLIRL